MALIELKNTTLYIESGLSGTAAVNNGAGYAAGATTMAVDTVVTNVAGDTDSIPVGARFTVVGSTLTHTVTARTEASGATTDVTFSPAIDGAVVDNAVITILPNRIEAKVGAGNIQWTEADEWNYDLDRGLLDTVRTGDEQPLQVQLGCKYEFIRTGTGETITPADAIKRRGSASSWRSSSSDECEPYAVNIKVVYTPPCGGAENEVYVFPDFRPDQRVFDIGAGSINITGRCNAVEPIITRNVTNP